MLALKEQKKRLNSIEKKAGLILFFLSLGSIYYQSVAVFLGVVFGGSLSLVNLRLLRKIVENLFHQKPPNKSLIVRQFVIKIALLFGIVYFLATYKLVNIVAFVVGFSVFLVAIIIESLYPPYRPTYN